MRRALAQQSGVSLVWVLIVVLVLLIVATTALFAVNARFGTTATEHREQQAYYTAHSALDTVSRWIASGTDPNSDADHKREVEKLLETVKTKTRSGGGVDYPLQGLDDTLGECTLHLEYTDTEMTRLKLTATATFANVTETLSLTMQQGASVISKDEVSVSDYNGEQYDARATELANLESGGIVALYEPNNNDNTNSNQTDLDLLDSYISNVSSTAEARWTNVDLTDDSKAHDDNALGTQHYPTNDSDDTATDNRRFMVPTNGRITIDPLEQDGHDGSASKPNVTETEDNNTRIVAMAIDNTAGKEVLFRLASGSSATKYGLLNIKRGEDFYDRSRPRWASLLMFNFTDNANETENLDYTINGSKRSYTWHPNKWKKLDIFVQPDAEVVSNLVIGPFGHKHNNTMDYRSYGNFVDNWHGGPQPGDFKYQWPEAGEKRGSQMGLPIFPADYGKNVGFWILDKRPDRYFRIMQGVNIMSGTIYSTRPTIIGGALIRTGSGTGHTTDNLNREINGFADKDPADNATYVEATTRYTLFIHNTDIVLKAPSSGTAASKIRRPDTWRDRLNKAKATTKEKSYDPAVIIKGGTIYIDKGQELTIEGTVTGVRSGTDPTIVPLDNMWINPDKIVVAAGGSLIIEASATVNVLTDIYVDGGKLTINKGARIKGNIYAYNGADVNLTGNFWLSSPKSTVAEQERDGLFIYGEDTVGIRVGRVTIHSAAHVTVPQALVAINGSLSTGSSPSRVHLVGGDWADLVSGTTLKPGSAKWFLCEGYDKETGQCPHIAEYDSGGWKVGIYMRE
jgi:type II secretory pathway pseudopilin PulG